MDVFLLEEHRIALENYRDYLYNLAAGAAKLKDRKVYSLLVDVADAYHEQISDLKGIIKQMEGVKYGESAAALN